MSEKLGTGWVQTHGQGEAGGEMAIVPVLFSGRYFVQFESHPRKGSPVRSFACRTEMPTGGAGFEKVR
jgi:hypothetical protein